MIQFNNSSSVMEAETILKNAVRPKSQTSKENFFRKSIIFLAIFFVIASFDCFAQKITEGSLKFLKGQDKLHVVLNFDDVVLHKKTEREYLAMENEQWVEGWQTAKTSIFKEKLLEHLNKNCNVLCGDFPEAQYQAVVRVLKIERKLGYSSVGQHLEGPGARRITCEVVFTEIGDSYPLAKVSIRQDSKANTSVFTPTKIVMVTNTIGSAGSNTHLTGVAFGYIGQELGKLMNKKSK